MMCNRLAFKVQRSMKTSLCGICSHHTQTIAPLSSTLFDRIYKTPVSTPNYVMQLHKSNRAICRTMGNQFSTDATEISIPVVSYDEIKDLPNHPGKAFLIDVREPDELKETGIIPTAINIPLGEVNTALNMSNKQFQAKYNHPKPDYNDEIIFHCRIGRRSEMAAINAVKLNYKNAKNYQGSWLDWAEREGLPK